MMEKNQSKCQKLVGSGFQVYECGRSVKGNLKDGTLVCGIHLAAERKRDANWEKYETEQKEYNAFNNEVKEFAKAHGLKTLSARYKSLRFVTMDFAELIETLDGGNDEEQK
jgi:hypothetical protein